MFPEPCDWSAAAAMLISTPSHCTDCALHCCHLNVVSTILQLQICCLPSALCIYRSWPEEDKWGAGSCTRLVVSCSVGGDCLALKYLGPACARLSRQVSRQVSRGRCVAGGVWRESGESDEGMRDGMQRTGHCSLRWPVVRLQWTDMTLYPHSAHSAHTLG